VFIGSYNTAIESNGIGNVGRVVEYARLAFSDGIVYVLTQHWTVTAMKRLVEDSAAHWNWPSRLRRGPRTREARPTKFACSYIETNDKYQKTELDRIQCVGF
jgi:hypothetical protein